MTIEGFNLPVGRIVSGNPILAQPKTNFKTKQPELGKDGQQIQQYRCDYAIPKADFLNYVWPVMVQEAATAYPINPQTGLPNVSEDFSWKYVDGDSPKCPKNSTVPYNAREGYQGHYVLKLSTEAFGPKCWVRRNGAFMQVTPDQLKTGDYVVANVNIKVHTDNDGGLYFNPNTYELVGEGDAIINSAGANPEQAFGQQAYQLPAGARPVGAAPAMPSAPMPAAPPMAPQQYQQAPAAPPAPQYAPQAAPMPAAPAYAPPAAPLPPPAHDFVNNAGQGAAPLAPMAPAPVAAYPQPMQAAPTVAHPATTAYPSNTMPPMPVR